MGIRALVLCALPLCLACTGSVSGVVGGGGPRNPGAGPSDSKPGGNNLPPDQTIAPPGAPAMPVMPTDMGKAQTCLPSIPSAPLRRLSHAEYLATMKDLLGTVSTTAPDILRDPASHGFENQARLLNPSAQLVEQYGTAAINTALKVSTNLPSVVPCTPKTAAEEKTCGAQFVEQLGAKVFRRPLTAEEKTDYQAYFESERAFSNFAGAVQLTTEALLQSPQFLYRVELGDPATAEPDRIKLTPFEVASRLSYLLWGRAPDAALLAKAQAGQLDSATDRESEARRLLADPRAREMFVEFHRQWLDFDQLAKEPKDAQTFPAYTPELSGAMREESDRFVAILMGPGEGTVRALLTSARTEVNAPLARLYGGVTVPASGWVTATLKPTERAGILTRANFLAGRAHMISGSPPLRASYVLQRLLCQTVPPPPADADLSEPVAKPGTTAAAKKTSRQLFEERTAPAACNSCHSLFGPLGYALENYDAIGAYRTTDNGLPVDATAHFRFGDVDWQLAGGIDLSTRLADSAQVQSCVATNWFQYALGRELETADQCRMAKLNAVLTEARGDIRELLVSLIKSPEFIYRKAIAP
jgi:hypothetical protein